MTNLPQIPDGIDVCVGEDRSKVRLPIFGKDFIDSDTVHTKIVTKP